MKVSAEVVKTRQELTNKLLRNEKKFTEVDATRLFDALEQERTVVLHNANHDDWDGLAFVSISYLEFFLLEHEQKRKNDKTRLG